MTQSEQSPTGTPEHAREDLARLEDELEERIVKPTRHHRTATNSTVVTGLLSAGRDAGDRASPRRSAIVRRLCRARARGCR